MGNPYGQQYKGFMIRFPLKIGPPILNISGHVF